jgi:hypothetical protein
MQREANRYATFKEILYSVSFAAERFVCQQTNSIAPGTSLGRVGRLCGGAAYPPKSWGSKEIRSLWRFWSVLANYTKTAMAPQMNNMREDMAVNERASAPRSPMKRARRPSSEHQTETAPKIIDTSMSRFRVMRALLPLGSLTRAPAADMIS